MKCYDTQTKEIFEVTPEEWKQAQDEYLVQQRDLCIFGRAPAIFTPFGGPVLQGHKHWVYKLNEEYVMIKFEDEYVHFRWSDELVGKKCFVADTLEDLEISFKHGEPKIILKEHNKKFPFEAESGWYRFCYYDPHYDFKVAFNEGKQIQFKLNDGHWRDIQGEPAWSESTEYRIKPAGLQWTDLKVGDIIHNSADHLTLMVIGIDENAHQTHICAGHSWITDGDLADNWNKVS